MIRTFGVLIQNVGAFTRNTEFSLLSLQSKSVSATVPYFRPCFPVLMILLHVQYMQCIIGCAPHGCCKVITASGLCVQYVQCTYIVACVSVCFHYVQYVYLPYRMMLKKGHESEAQSFLKLILVSQIFYIDSANEYHLCHNYFCF